jgi:hypothetical protein
LKVEQQLLQLKIDTVALSKKKVLKLENILQWELESLANKQVHRILIRWLLHLPQAKDLLNCRTVLRPLQELQVIEGRVVQIQTPNSKEISIWRISTSRKQPVAKVFLPRPISQMLKMKFYT